MQHDPQPFPQALQPALQPQEGSAAAAQPQLGAAAAQAGSAAQLGAAAQPQPLLQLLHLLQPRWQPRWQLLQLLQQPKIAECTPLNRPWQPWQRCRQHFCWQHDGAAQQDGSAAQLGAAAQQAGSQPLSQPQDGSAAF